ncbi:hypothetical protein CRYUN_Cryun35bG0085700 [Craigia yunnanensis]
MNKTESTFGSFELDSFTTLYISILLSKVTSTIAKMLGKQLSPLMGQLEQNKAGKVAAMLLEMDQQEVFDLIVSLDALKIKITEVMDSLHSS